VGRLVIIATLLVFASPVSLAAESSPSFQPITGPVTKILDGKTLIIKKSKITLWGIETPDQEPGTREAKTFLGNLTKNAEVTCLPIAKDPKQGTVASCGVEGQDVARMMVFAGMAHDDQSSNGFYAKAEKDARENHRGFWANRK
jgi:endonuclease YncB( thermonuclease family)